MRLVKQFGSEVNQNRVNQHAWVPLLQQNHFEEYPSHSYHRDHPYDRHHNFGKTTSLTQNADQINDQ